MGHDRMWRFNDALLESETKIGWLRTRAAYSQAVARLQARRDSGGNDPAARADLERGSESPVFCRGTRVFRAIVQFSRGDLASHAQQKVSAGAGRG